jgi:hypothetical protein
MSSFVLSFLDFEIDFNLDFEVDCNFELPDADCESDDLFMDFGEISEYIAAMDPYSTFAMYAEELMQEIEPRTRGSAPQMDGRPCPGTASVIRSDCSSDKTSSTVTCEYSAHPFFESFLTTRMQVDNIVNTYYGTVNNIRHVENARFEGVSGELTPSPHLRSLMGPVLDCGDTENCSAGYLCNDITRIMPTAKPPERQSEDPPNAFILFGSTLVKAQCSTEALEISDEAMCEIVTDAWMSLTPGDRSRIEDEAERVEELHLAMLATQKKASKGPKHRQEYWNFTGRITDFWLGRWKEVQERVAEHLLVIGKGLAGTYSCRFLGDAYSRHPVINI